ncbi:MAG TPA: hypothetical protein VGK40_06695, partial [Verrucomicrobiae bacterium]
CSPAIALRLPSTRPGALRLRLGKNMVFYADELDVRLEPDHPQFGGVHHDLIAIMFVKADTEEEANHRMGAYLKQYHFQLLRVKSVTGREEPSGGVDHPTAKFQLDCVRRFGVHMETFAVDAKIDLN